MRRAAFQQGQAHIAFNFRGGKADVMQRHDQAQTIQILIVILPATHHLLNRTAQSPAFVLIQNFNGNLVVPACFFPGHGGAAFPSARFRGSGFIIGFPKQMSNAYAVSQEIIKMHSWKTQAPVYLGGIAAWICASSAETAGAWA